MYSIYFVDISSSSVAEVMSTQLISLMLKSPTISKWLGFVLCTCFICRREIAASLNDFSNRWCKRENVEPDALKEWKINIFKIIDTRISFYSRNTHLLPPKPKSSFSHLKRGIQDFHMNYVLVPADKAANNVVVV